MELHADAGDHVRLRDRLTGADRERRVVVCAHAQRVGNEKLARDALHRGEHTLVVDPARAQLIGDHGPPAMRRGHG
jgi:hypothetical protein